MNLTPEQIASAQTPQQMAVSGANGTPTNQAITPSSLTPATPIQPVTPAPTPTPTVPDFLTLTQPEKQTQDQYSGISSAIASLTGELAGRDAYTTGQQQGQDIIGKTGAVTNYQNQLKALQQEQQKIDLQRQQNIQAKQEAMSGQGIASSIVNRHSAIDTQYNQQTLDNAVQQYKIGASLSAAQGDLTSALNYVDQAVKLKYQPIEAQLTAQQANLQAIQNSPNFTSAQKKQAAAQELQNKINLDSIATEKQNTKSVQALALQALQNGAPEPIVSKIYNSKDLGEAMGYAVGYAQKETAQSIQEYNFAVKNGYKGSFSQYQNEDANRKKSIAAAGVVTPSAPTSYKEWELAGKPGTYADYLKEQNIKAPTVAQQTVATYAARIEQAKPTIDNLTNSIANMNPVAFEAQVKLPSYLQTADFQQFDQASRNFINAVLRRESGAVISPSEFDNAYKQYLPKSGDTAATLEQKKQNRDVVYASLRKAAGNAYQSVDELLGGTQGGQTSEFDQYTNDINPIGADQATIPRSVWNKVQNKDALLQYVQSLGRKLLVTD